MDEFCCKSCGRPMENIEKIQKNKDRVYCSKQCSKERLDKRDLKLEDFILFELKKFKDSSLCPSQISRMYFEDESWRSKHQRVIKACRRLHIAKRIKITQKKQKIKSLNFKGPFRIQII